MSVPSPTIQSDELSDIAVRAARSGGVMFFARGVRFLFIVVVNFILINLLLPADFGMVRYVMLVVGIASLLNEMGLTTAIVQKEHLEERSLWSLFLISSAWGLFLYVLIFFLSPIFAWYFSTPELTALLRVGALMIPVAGVTAVHRAWLRRKMAFRDLAVIETGAAAFSSIVSVTMAATGFGVWALVTGNILFEAGISLILLVRFPVRPERFYSIPYLESLLFFGIIIVLSRLVDYILGATPFFLIGKLIGKEGLGLFSVAFDIANFPRMAMLASLVHVMLSTFSRLQSDERKQTAAFSRLLLTISLLTMPLLLVMIFMPHQLLQMICVFKKESAWLASAPLLRWLAAMGIIYVFTAFPNSLWIAIGKVKQTITVSIAMLITTVAAVAAGVHWGIEGICVAMFLRALVVFLPYVYIHYRLTGMPVTVFLGTLVPSLVAGAGMAAVLLLTGYLVQGVTLKSQLVALLSGVAGGTLLYAIILFLFFRSAVYGLRGIVLSLLPRRR